MAACSRAAGADQGRGVVDRDRSAELGTAREGGHRLPGGSGEIGPDASPEVVEIGVTLATRARTGGADQGVRIAKGHGGAELRIGCQGGDRLPGCGGEVGPEIGVEIVEISIADIARRSAGPDEGIVVRQRHRVAELRPAGDNRLGWPNVDGKVGPGSINNIV